MSEQRSPEEIRRDIEATREELADTAAALAYKADVKARAHDRVEEVKGDLRSRVDGARATVTERVGELKAKVPAGDGTDAPGTASSVRSAAAAAGSTVETTVRTKPVESAAVVAALLGFALGYLIARRRA